MSETPEIVERVAKSMYDGFLRAVGHNFGPDWAPIPFEAADAQCQRYYRSAAREGIQAMREPTEAQIKATSLHDWIGHPEANPAAIERWHVRQRNSAIRRWQDGIDAALVSPEEGREP